MKKLLAVFSIAAVSAFFLARTTRENSLSAPGFTPIRDDAAAERYAPSILSGSKYGDPVALYYRAAMNGDRLHITYHYVWENEENPHPGFLPFLNRIIYTGGLRLQKIMFGPADIEKVSVVIGAGQIESVLFETAGDYNPSAFGVAHKPVSLTRAPAAFRVMSWNHLFEAAEAGPVVPLKPEYFSEEKWQAYEMVKLKESFLSRSRAHEPYERIAAP
jgi:hypothetical protein